MSEPLLLLFFLCLLFWLWSCLFVVCSPWRWKSSVILIRVEISSSNVTAASGFDSSDKQRNKKKKTVIFFFKSLWMLTMFLFRGWSCAIVLNGLRKHKKKDLERLCFVFLFCFFLVSVNRTESYRVHGNNSRWLYDYRVVVMLRIKNNNL